MSTLDHGVATYARLLESGLQRPQIDQLVSIGRLVRVRRGWYAVPPANPDVLRAVKAGGALSCVSALRYHGVWVPPTSQLHIRTSEHHRAAVPPGIKRCCSVRAAPTLAVDPLPTALRAALSCLDDEGIVVVLDSLRNLRLFNLVDLTQLLSTQSARIRRLLAMTVGDSQSGTETMVRVRLQRHRVSVRPQVVIAGVGRVDLLVGDRLVLEVDSHEHHTGPENYTRDRNRDRALVRLGYLVIRITYSQVVYGWAEVWPDLLAIIRADRHHWTRRIRFQNSA